MSDLPTPRYRVGDVVYAPYLDRRTETLPCPDCLGSREWRAVSPAGIEHVVACPRCTDRYAHVGTDRLPSLVIERHAPAARRLTIGSVTAKSHRRWKTDSLVEYMANETGIGSGSVYSEFRLFPDEAGALAVAAIEANEANAKLDERPAVVAARRFAGLTLNPAIDQLTRDAVYDSWRAFRWLRDDVESVLPENSETDSALQSEVRGVLRRYDDYQGVAGGYADHPIEALIRALDAPDELPAAVARLKELLAARPHAKR